MIAVTVKSRQNCENFSLITLCENGMISYVRAKFSIETLSGSKNLVFGRANIEWQDLDYRMLLTITRIA